MKFKDHFSERAALYAAHRPHYPPALFAYVSGLARGHAVAIDVGTGNGQAAVGLAAHFTRVIAVDPSPAQISNAEPHDRVEYRIARAESTGLPAHSADLVTAAQALHWLDASAFFAEAKRVLISDGVIAIWGYGDPILDATRLEKKLSDFNRGLLEPFWSPERGLLLDGYRSLAFPLDEVPAPSFELTLQWSLPELAGYVRSWSAVANFVAEHGVDPVIDLERSLADDWGNPASPRQIRWPLFVRAGYNRA